MILAIPFITCANMLIIIFTCQKVSCLRWHVNMCHFALCTMLHEFAPHPKRQTNFKTEFSKFTQS